MHTNTPAPTASCHQLRCLCVNMRQILEDGANSPFHAAVESAEVGGQVGSPYASPVPSPLIPVQPCCSPLQPAPGSEGSCRLHLLCLASVLCVFVSGQAELCVCVGQILSCI